MTLSDFIQARIDPIVTHWEAFARQLPAGRSMTALALRDHSREILLAIAGDMVQPQSATQRSAQSQDTGEAAPPAGTAAAEHGELRQLAGFDLVQLFAEFRALRASVMALWKASGEACSTDDALDQLMRFNEGMDKAIAESVHRYSGVVETSRDMFLAVLGHDLRGPLQGIGMSAMLLARPGLDDATRQQAAARLNRASSEMAGLITDLLEYTRTRLGAGMPMELGACDLGAVCEDALESVRTGAPEQRFVQTLSGDLHLNADATRLRQALSNLLSNAVQHGDGSGAITLGAHGEADTVVLQVGNQGEPIDPEALPGIYEPLVRAPNAAAQARHRSKTSLGLGLFIVREIVRGHGGTIEVRSDAATGTVFTLRLPRHPAPSPGPA